MPPAAPAPLDLRARLLIGGVWTDGIETFPVHDKFTGEIIGCADRASRDQVRAAVAAAQASFESTPLDATERYAILRRVGDGLEARREELVRVLTAETGFPVSDTRNEVTRAIQTFLIAAEEGKRLVGEVVPIEAAPGSAHRMGFTIRVPRGVVCGITSFNAPLNFVAHKAAPALASGNTVVLKAPQATPFSAAILCEILLAAGLPPGHVNLVQGPGSEIGRWLVDDPRVRFYTFTGSTSVGKQLQKSVGLRPIAVELGSIAATIVCADADLDRALPRVVNSAFRRAGQACTSTQRLFVQRPVLDAFVARLAAATAAVVVGDPREPATVLGPMISAEEAARAEAWVAEAVAAGARLVTGGRRRGAILEPTILIDVNRDMKVLCEEIFAPVMSVVPFDTLDEVIAAVNSTEFGLAAGIFTRDVTTAFTAARRLHVGVVHINESSTSRVDLMPFTGVKDSGLGREGPKYAMHEMTEERLVTLSL
ncbi:MAG: aldehyde dehydrogenase family protein [Acidobacteria bacterium]|nr:aldehyde dehydrogenase family protein [Acidobacteriota bacterium]